MCALKRLAGRSAYVLPKRRNNEPDQPSSAQLISRSVTRLRDRFRTIGVAPFTPHDQRRTVRTQLAIPSVPEDIAERVLNPSRGEMVNTYDLHKYVPEKRSALQKWESHLRALLPNRGLNARRAASPHQAPPMRLQICLPLRLANYRTLNQVKHIFSHHRVTERWRCSSTVQAVRTVHRKAAITLLGNVDASGVVQRRGQRSDEIVAGGFCAELELINVLLGCRNTLAESLERNRLIIKEYSDLCSSIRKLSFVDAVLDFLPS